MSPTSRSAQRRRALTSLATLLVAGAVVTAGSSVVTIRPGDTLWELARKHDTTVAELQRLNKMAGRATIYAGGQLRVPGAAAPASPTRTVVTRYRVVRGDTLTGIARKHGTTVRALQARNPSTSRGIARLGAVLEVSRVTVRAVSAPAAPTHNAGVAIPGTVRSAAQQHRAVLATRPLPSKAEARGLVARSARRQGVPVSLALAVAYHESGFQQRVVSSVDAIGIMQVLPSTGRGLSRSAGRDLDLLKAEDNVYAGVLLLKQLLRATGSVEGALAGYYQGLGSVSRRGLLPQTTQYIKSIAVLQPRFARG